MLHKNRKKFRNIHFYCCPKQKALILKWKQLVKNQFLLWHNLIQITAAKWWHMISHSYWLLELNVRNISTSFKWFLEIKCVEKWTSIRREFRDLKVVVNKTLQTVKWKVINKPFEFDSIYVYETKFSQELFLHDLIDFFIFSLTRWSHELIGTSCKFHNKT